MTMTRKSRPRRRPVRAVKPETDPDPRGAAARPAGSWRTFALAAASSLMLWAALPPLSWWPLAWIAPLPWLWLIQMPKLPGRWPYLAIYMAGFLHWLAVIEGIRLAHPALYGGWIALSWYLGFYPLVFVVLGRVAVHRCRVPLVLAAPAVWVGLELTRGHLITGFSAALLGHTQYQWLSLIQISDLFGAYGVSFVMMICAAAAATWGRFATCQESPSTDSATMSFMRKYSRPAAGTTAAAIVLIATLAYGNYRLNEYAAIAEQREGVEPLRVALLQESVETIFDYDLKRSKETFRRYLELAETAVDERPEVDLIVWPESSFNSVYPVIEVAPDALPPAGTDWSNEELNNFRQYAPLQSAAKAHEAAARLGNSAALLAGTDVYSYGERTEHFNAAAFYSAGGKLEGYYGKMHRVMFGEYIPFGDAFPFLYAITPMSSGLTPGREAKAFTHEGIQMAPNICFESVVPHLIRRQVKQLDGQGQPPDVLINLTNDGWFKGSAILDLHHICGVFRAVENRRPLLMAANIGITSAIDATGHVDGKLSRYEVDVLYADVYPSVGGLSHYTVWGDWAAGLCLVFTVGMAVVGIIGRLHAPQAATRG